MQFEKEIVILGADKKAAMANAKLKVFEEALLEELEKDFELPELEIPKIKAEERNSQWVHSNPLPTRKVSRSERNHEPLSTPEQIRLPFRPIPKERKSEKTDLLPELQVLNPDLPRQQSTDEDRVVPQNTIFNRQPLVSSTPLKDITRSQLTDSLTVANQHIVAGLARQNFPKCQPDIFSGDPTLFHPWKTAFKAMLLDTDVSPTQEINYLRSFTSGRPQRLVDNYRKRQMCDPVVLLKELWEELKRRFGSVAVISNTLLECLRDTATFDERENHNLQQFADLCADIESQVTYLPGLACLNYPNAMQPITAKLPQFIRAKWEKEIAYYSNSNGGAYPPFSRFSKIVQEQSKIKNNPNVLASKAASPTQVSAPKPRKEKKTFKTETQPPAGKDSAREEKRGP